MHSFQLKIIKIVTSSYDLFIIYMKNTKDKYNTGLKDLILIEKDIHNLIFVILRHYMLKEIEELLNNDLIYKLNNKSNIKEKERTVIKYRW